MDIFKQFEKALGMLNTIESNEKLLQEKQAEYDNKIQWVLHYIENNSVNTKTSYRLMRELKTLRRERREVKNNLDILRSFHENEDKLKGCDNRSMLLGQLRKVKNRQEQWIYTNDCYTNEEIEKILN